MKLTTAFLCPMCGNMEGVRIFEYHSPPKGETVFVLPGGCSYDREIWQCQLCGHFVNQHQFNLSALYEADYVDSTYGQNGLQATFQRIMNLPPDRSDNVHRVKKIVAFMGHQSTQEIPSTKSVKKPTVLDVGSGLCVFLKRMKEEGWDCTALDPDQRNIQHAKEYVGVKAICADFMAVGPLGHFDLITFNKVLEHVVDPIGMLKKSRDYLADSGIVYVEVPDGEIASQYGPGREEFFIEHRSIFSMLSLSLLAKKAGFLPLEMVRLQEPSTKYTVHAFLKSAVRR